MRIKILTVVALTALGLSGCSLWTKSDKAESVTQSDRVLRSSPTQAYQFDGQLYDVEIYDSASQYRVSNGYDGYGASGGYTLAPSYISAQNYYYGYNDAAEPALRVAETTDPRDVAFVKLNGESEALDWRNCETLHRGYLRLTEYEFRLDPEFEVCMRNKGYVLTTEAGFITKPSLNAQNAGLRSSSPQYSYPTSSSAYFP